jgi:hypothetical protein
MSRSFKKPWVKDRSRNGQKILKRQAAKVVRKYSHYIPDGRWYRKLFERWNLCDYRFRMYKREVENDQDLYYPWYRYTRK